MLTIENAVLTNQEQMKFIIQGARNPLNSWHLSDTDKAGIGKVDLGLLARLSAAGTDHRKYMRMMTVYVRVTAPMYWWKEMDTYKVGTVGNSCSTMHKIHSKPFVLDDFSHDHMDRYSLDWLADTICMLNHCRNKFNETKDKKWWWQIIQILPMSYNQTRNLMLNYEVLKNIYFARKDHKLDEWHTLCDWIETLPYAKELILNKKAE